MSINSNEIGQSNIETKKPVKAEKTFNQGPFEPIPENKFLNSIAKQLLEYENPEEKKSQARRMLQNVATSTRNFEIPIKSNYKSPVIDANDLPDIFETLMTMLQSRKKLW